MLAPLKSFETGQPCLAFSACSRKAASVIPGTSASVTRSMRGIEKPSAPFSRCTLAVVWTRLGGKPACARPCDRAIEKQPACAAAISSSGLVPWPDSKREANEYGPW